VGEAIAGSGAACWGNARERVVKATRVRGRESGKCIVMGSEGKWDWILENGGNSSCEFSY
jgi:hypothetical protein